MKNFEALLEEIGDAGADPARVSIGDLRDRLGHRSFGPLLLMAALPPMTPLAAIPGLATTLSVIIFLTAGQVLLRMSHIWLPAAILRRSLPRENVDRTIRLLKPVVGCLDKLVGPRLPFMVREPCRSIVAACCCLLAVTMPPLEFVPLTSGIPAFPVAVFGLALFADDGLLVLLGLAALVISAAVVISLL